MRSGCVIAGVLSPTVSATDRESRFDDIEVSNLLLGQIWKEIEGRLAYKRNAKHAGHSSGDTLTGDSECLSRRLHPTRSAALTLSKGERPRAEFDYELDAREALPLVGTQVIPLDSIELSVVSEGAAYVQHAIGPKGTCVIMPADVALSE